MLQAISSSNITPPSKRLKLSFTSSGDTITPQTDTSQERKIENYSQITGSAIGAVGAAAGIIKTEKTVKPLKDFINTTKEAVEPMLKIGEDQYKAAVDAVEKSGAAMPDTVASAKELINYTKEHSQELGDFVKNSGTLKAAAEDAVDAAGQIVEENFPETCREALKGCEAARAVQSAAAKEISQDALKAAAGQAMEAGKQIAGENLPYLEQEFKQSAAYTPELEDMLERGIQAVKSESAEIDEDAIAAATDELLQKTNKNMAALEESLEKSKANMAETFKPYAEKISNALKNLQEGVKEKGITETFTSACNSAMKQVKKYEKAGIFASLMLIPAGLGIGTLIAKAAAKVSESKSQSEENN